MRINTHRNRIVSFLMIASIICFALAHILWKNPLMLEKYDGGKLPVVTEIGLVALISSGAILYVHSMYSAIYDTGTKSRFTLIAGSIVFAYCILLAGFHIDPFGVIPSGGADHCVTFAYLGWEEYQVDNC